MLIKLIIKYLQETQISENIIDRKNDLITREW